MKNIKNIQFGKLAMIAAIAFMATSCQQDEVLDQYDPKPQGEMISFHIQRGWDFDKISRSTGTQYGEHISDNNIVSEDNSESMKMGVYQQPIGSWFGEANSRGSMIQSADFSEFMAFGYKTKTENGTATTTPIFKSSYHDITNNTTDNIDDAGWEKPVGTGENANGYYWPGSDYTCSFFGISMSDGKLTDTTSGTSVYNNVTTKKNTAGQIIGFDYTVPALAVNQPDIMVAAANNIPGDGSSSVSLDFKHILTAVNVKVGVKTGETTMPNGKITSIKFKNIYGKGTYSVETNTWSGFREWANGDGTAGSTGIGLQEYSVDLGDEGYTTNGITQNTQVNTVNATFMMLPQSLPSNAVIEIEYLHDGTETPVKLSAPIGGSSWNMGVETNYLINISPDNNLMFVSAITPKDAHYIMVDFNIKAQNLSNAGWTMTAEASDGSAVTLRTDLTELQQQGYWTVNERGEPTITKTSSGTEVKVWAFVEENLGSTDRTITLKLYNAATNELADTKTFTQLCMSSARSERLQETGEVPWGFKWDRKVTYHAAPTWSGSNLGIILKNLFAAVLFNSIGQDVADQYPDAVDNEVLTVKPNYSRILLWDLNTSTDIIIDYGKLDNLDTTAQDKTDGLSNTNGLYYFNGIASISDLETLLDNEKAGFAESAISKKEEGTLTDNSYINNFAAKSCVMKNKFYAEPKTVEEDGGSRTYYVPVLSSEETANTTDNFNYLNWYLPASTEYAGINTAEGTGAYKLDGVYWTSTAVADDNVNSYIYTPATGEGTDDRMTPHLVRCKRKQ